MGNDVFKKEEEKKKTPLRTRRSVRGVGAFPINPQRALKRLLAETRNPTTLSLSWHRPKFLKNFIGPTQKKLKKSWRQRSHFFLAITLCLAFFQNENLQFFATMMNIGTRRGRGWEGKYD